MRLENEIDTARRGESAIRSNVTALVGNPGPSNGNNGKAPNADRTGEEVTTYTSEPRDVSARVSGAPSLTAEDRRVPMLVPNERASDNAGQVASASSALTPPDTSPPSPRGEIRLLQHGRQALNAGRASEAIEYLQEARMVYPSGVLSEERDTLMIEALELSGHRRAALELERVFETTYARSAQIPHVRSLVLGNAALP